jgi:hypothetical protein
MIGGGMMWRWVKNHFLAVLVGVILLNACTRNVDLTVTPLMPPGITPTTSSQVSIAEMRPTMTPADLLNPPEPERESEVNQDSPALLYSVLFLAEGEVLNVREGAGVTEPVVGALQSNERNLKPTGQRTLIEGDTWIELENSDGVVGWVSGRYLTEQSEPGMICDDPGVGVLLDQFTNAVREKDGRMLSRLISPMHGLIIHHNLWNPPVEFEDPQVVSMLFTSTVDYDWGVSDGTGDALIGPFKMLVLPKIEDVLLQSHTRHCNTLERDIATGPTAGYVYWPYDYGSLDFIALYRPAPADQELDWRTWAVGIEYVDGKPYIAVLIQFHWEI